MSDRDDYIYPERVRFEIADTDFAAYASAAETINRQAYDVLSVQHEYGIFGGEAGCYLMNLLREVKMPIVTTLHTVLREPSRSQKAVFDELMRLSERVVVMSEKAVGFLKQDLGVPPEKVDLIHHGIPEIPVETGQEFRAKLGIEGPMILTFGLLSPDKGIQYVIEAMPKIVREHPGATFVLVGATHPHVRASSGENYRRSLETLARDLGVSANVRFVDRFVATEELVRYLGAMDIYITPYLNPKQITSGTLAYSVGAGKVVISTPYWYAEELLADGRGVIVPFRNSDAIAEAILSTQRDPEATAEMGATAAAFGKTMLWPEVGARYVHTFAQAVNDRAARKKRSTLPALAVIHAADTMPELRISHLQVLSDDTGILQHATHSIPNRDEGYCVDDNARALLLTAYASGTESFTPELSLMQSRYLSFVMAAFNPATGRFRNFMSYDRQWLEESGSEDSHGRSMWALGTLIGRCKDRGRRAAAKSYFIQAIPALDSTTSPRTWAYAILGATEYMREFPHEYEIQVLKESMANRLIRQYGFSQSDDWPWFEQSLSYANARLSQALIVAGESLGNNAMLRIGVSSLEWLMQQQSCPVGDFAPIGSNGFYPRGGTRAYFDQQPVEAWASVSACLAAHRVTGNPLWLGEARRAFNWFLGGNMLGQVLVDRINGGCHDGLHEKRINRNQGAESTLSYLCSLAELRERTPVPRLRAAKTGVHEIF